VDNKTFVLGTAFVLGVSGGRSLQNTFRISRAQRFSLGEINNELKHSITLGR
jgi:hypothetical protein